MLNKTGHFWNGLSRVKDFLSKLVELNKLRERVGLLFVHKRGLYQLSTIVFPK